MKDPNVVNVCSLTTFDNKFDYYEQFDEWDRFDREQGYNTCSLIDRFERDPAIPSDFEVAKAHEDAIDRIIALFPTMYKKVVKETYKFKLE